jgi:hypothetical protein
MSKIFDLIVSTTDQGKVSSSVSETCEYVRFIFRQIVQASKRGENSTLIRFSALSKDKRNIVINILLILIRKGFVVNYGNAIVEDDLTHITSVSWNR